MNWTPDRIKALRERLGLTQTAFAEAIGLSRHASVSDLETGRTSATGTLARLLDAISSYGPNVGRAVSGNAAARLDAAAAEIQAIAQAIRSTSTDE